MDSNPVFGQLSVLNRDPDHPQKSICKCSCGKIVSVWTTNLRSGNTKSCGCLKPTRRPKSTTKIRLVNNNESINGWQSRLGPVFFNGEWLSLRRACEKANLVYPTVVWYRNKHNLTDAEAFDQKFEQLYGVRPPQE